MYLYHGPVSLRLDFTNQFCNEYSPKHFIDDYFDINFNRKINQHRCKITVTINNKEFNHSMKSGGD